MAKITFHAETVEARNDLADRLSISMEQAANHAVLIYRDIIFTPQNVEPGDGFKSTFGKLFGDKEPLSEAAQQLKRRGTQQAILDEEEDIKFHRKRNRAYTLIK